MKKYRVFFDGQSVDIRADKVEKNDAQPSWEQEPGKIAAIQGCTPQFSLTFFKGGDVVGFFPHGIPRAYVVLEGE